MAKRRRLGPAIGAGAFTMAEPRPPIAHVVGETAERAALDEVATALRSAREEGRLAQPLPIASVETGHLVRDRLAFDEGEMRVLQDSLRARGQQVPVEVVALEDGRYGLISGLRRIEALTRNGAETVLAVIRRPDGAPDAYLAMVEENEIRAGVSFYERARVAVEAARLGVYPDTAAAIRHLFAATSAPKRSKIGSFVQVYEAFDDALRFPTHIPERLGLALAKALNEMPGFADRLCKTLSEGAPDSVEAERSLLEQALKCGSEPSKRPAPPRAEVVPGLMVEGRAGRLVLTGPAVTEDLREALSDWLRAR